MKKIIVVGYPYQTQTQHQIQTLRRLGYTVIEMNPYGEQGVYQPITWQNDRILWQDEDISSNQIDGVLLPALAPEFPQQDAFQQGKQHRLDWADWYRAACLQRDRSDTLLGLLLMYEQHKVRLINPPSASMISRRKPYQLSVLRRLRCPLPDTLISNHYPAVNAFIQQYDDVILKPASGGALTLTPEHISEERLKRIRLAPAIFQQRIHGSDIRVMVVDDQVVSAAKINVPDHTLDFRGDQTYQQGQITYDAITLPKKIAALCVALTQQLGLVVGGIDLKLTATGDFYFLECNSSPIYLDVERKLQHPITEIICLNFNHKKY
ncbi:MAG: ATP-grasp domain-containing protein [bacterium]